MNRRIIALCAAIAALLGRRKAGIGTAEGRAQGSRRAPAGYPTVVAVENLGKKLSAATNGRLSVQMFAAMQLGGEKEMIEQAQIGALHRARQRRRARTADRRSQRVQPAIPVPQHRAHAEGHRRTDRRGNAQQDLRPSEGRADRHLLDERGCTQRLRHQTADQDVCDLKGLKSAGHGQPDLRRHDERARRQRRCDGLRPAVRRAADRRGRRCRKQSAELVFDNHYRSPSTTP